MQSFPTIAVFARRYLLWLFPRRSQMNTPASATLRTRVKRHIKWPLIALVASLPDSVQSALFMPKVRRFGERVPVLRTVYTGCYRTHPIDRTLGTDTGGIFPPEPLFGVGIECGNLPYMGAQPSIVRRALKQLGDVCGHTFIDIGCGKGRPMIVATEFPFEAVLGYDLAAPLVAIANRNAKIVARAHPERTPMQAFVADALELRFTQRRLVIFLFNPFGASVISMLLSSLERALAEGSVEALRVVYMFPVCAHVFDGSPMLVRDWSADLPYEPDEIGYGNEYDRNVVVWKSVERKTDESSS
jgi:SAM-dependent methyltransferase